MTIAELANLIEAILFYQAEPLRVERLASLTKKPEGEVRDALKVLEEKLSHTGLRLLTNGEEVTLGTSPDAGATIEAITKEELSKELSKASLETLAIVLYKGPITRAEIDYVRGVNSTFILRNLLIRGLVEKIDNPGDQRSFLYKPTFALLEHMGVTRIEDLPGYSQTQSALAEFLATHAEETRSDKEGGSESESEEASALPETEPDAPDTTNDLSDIYDPLSEVTADITEEDEAVGNFDDQALQDHRETDQMGV